jgi:hypothetical protein
MTTDVIERSASVPVATTELIPDGIHFGMPEERYHPDPALGSTRQKDLVIDPIEYQYGRIYGAEKKETFALKWGSGIHCRALEGRESLKERFPIAPALADYEDALVTFEHLKTHAKKLGLSKVGTKKEDFISAIRDFDKEVPIWDEILAKFNAENAAKTILPRDALEHIERAAQWMQRDAELAPVMEDGTFTAGASEVSIFYTENGVRLKARIDHLLAHGVIDLKSFRPMFSENILAAAKRAVSRMRYDLQAASYMRALHAAAKLYEQGLVFNNPYGSDFLKTVFKTLAAGQMEWVWVLIKASGAPQPVVRKFDMNSMLFKTAAMQIDDAINNYRNLTTEFGQDEVWMPTNSAETWGDMDFSPFAFQ